MAIRKVNPKNYTPLPKHSLFHRSGMFIRLLRGGVGSGKTLAGAAESVWLSIENAGLDGMIVAPTWSILHRVTLRTFLALLPPSIIRSHRKVERFVELTNRSRIYYGSADQPATLEGSNLAWAWGDEARYWRREAWQILLARVRHPRAARRSIIITTTPSMGWLYDEFGSGVRADAFEVIVSSADNPYLPPSFVESLRSRYSAALFRQYVEGQWCLLEGAVFADFDQAHHIAPIEAIDGVEVHVGVDFGYRRSAAVFFQHIPYCYLHRAHDCIHVIDELLPDSTPTTILAEQIVGLYAARAWKRGVCYVDPAGAAHSIQVGYSDVQILESRGLSCAYTYQPELRYIPTGIELIRSKLRTRSGLASLFISARLTGAGHERGIVASLIMSHYPEARDGRPVVDEPTKDGTYDHARDALRYGLINRLGEALSISTPRYA